MKNDFLKLIFYCIYSNILLSMDKKNIYIYKTNYTMICNKYNKTKFDYFLLICLVTKPD